MSPSSSSSPAAAAAAAAAAASPSPSSSSTTPSPSPSSSSSSSSPSSPPRRPAAMRIIVPLQGVVQGRAGVFWGSLIPCALFYFLQLYIRQRRPSLPGSDPEDSAPEEEEQEEEEEDSGPDPTKVSQHPPASEDSLPPKDSPAPDAGPRPNLRRTSSSGSNLARIGSYNDVGNYFGSYRSGSSFRSPRRPSFVSARAVSVIGTGDSPYYIGWKEHSQNPFHSQENPHGVIQLGLAENKISLDLLQDWLTTHPDACLWNEDQDLKFQELALYQNPHGIPAFKSVMASFMEELLGGNMKVNAENIVITAGATAAIDILTFCIAEPGDALLIPSPYYPGFDRDIKWRNGIELVPVPCHSSEGFNISRSAIEKAFIQTQRRGITVRGLLITSPGNPVGNILDLDTFRSLFDFAREKHIHLISDEVYAASVYNGHFVSALEILGLGEHDHNLVHIIYGLSKDFAIPGLRVGVLYTANEKVLLATRNLARFCGISSHTQRLLVFLFRDKAFIKRYMDENKKRLLDRHNVIVEGLQESGVSCAKSNGGFYCWVDFRHLLTSNTMDAEKELWKKLLYELKINVTPGYACHCSEPGWFRLCFASIDEEDIGIVFTRLRSFIKRTK